jgi:hypothetical protein
VLDGMDIELDSEDDPDFDPNDYGPGDFDIDVDMAHQGYEPYDDEDDDEEYAEYDDADDVDGNIEFGLNIMEAVAHVFETLHEDIDFVNFTPPP